MNLVNVGVVLDPTQTAQGAAAVKKEFDGVAEASDKMQASVASAAQKAGKALGGAGTGGTAAGRAIAQGGNDGAKGLSAVEAASKRAQAALQGAAAAGGFLQRSLEYALGGVIERLGEKGLEAALEIPYKVIETGLEYDDVLRKVTISLAGMLQQQRPDQIQGWNQALLASGAVVDQLQKKVQQFHFDSVESLSDTFRSITTGTKGFGMSLQEQIDLASKLMAALRAYNVDGQQASRDVIDLLVGRGERLVAMKEILGTTGMETFNENLKKVQSGAADPKVLIDQLNAAVDKIADAAEHANEVLSAAWGSFKQQIAQALGKETQPLYDTLVDELNRVRQVLQFGDFDAMKPFVSTLQEAVKLAGDLAIGLAVDPSKTGDLLLAAIKYGMSAGIDFLVTEIPRIIPAFIAAVKTFGPLILDVMFEAAAILTTAVQAVMEQVKAPIAVAADNANLGTFLPSHKLNQTLGETGGRAVATATNLPWKSEADYNSMIDQRDKDQATANGQFPDMTKRIQDNFSNNRASSSQLMDQLMTSLHLDTPKDDLTHQSTEQLRQTMEGLRTDIKNEAAAARAEASKNQAQHDQQVKNYASPSFVGPIPPTYQKDVQDYQVLNQPGTKSQGQKGASDYIAQINDKILQDKIAQNQADATGNQVLIDKAKLAIQVDDYQKEALDNVKELNGQTPITADQMAKVASMTAQYAQTLAAAQAHTEAIKDNTQAIALAEEQATAARGRVQQVQQDPFTSQLNKRPELLASYDAEIAALQKVIALNQQDINSGKLNGHPDALASRQKEIDSSNKEIITAQTQKSIQTDGGQFNQDITKYMDSLGTAGTNTANIITGTLNTAISATSDNIQKVIAGTETWGQAFQNIGIQILEMLEQMILKMILATAVQAGLSAMGGGSAGGLFGMMAATNHTGGIVGEESTSLRYLPRYHNGGVSDDEQVAVLKKGEAVLTPGQMRAISGGRPSDSAGGKQVQVHITTISDPNEAAQHIMNNPDTILVPLAARRKQLRALVS